MPFPNHRHHVATASGLITLYARYEPALVREPLLDAMSSIVPGGFAATLRIRNVVLYADPSALMEKAHFGSFDSQRPTHRSKTVVLNCSRWKLHWLPDLQCTTRAEVEALRRERAWRHPLRCSGVKPAFAG